jgi:tRNA-2-methylthio-N6-dimethylallyladenosine synthase
MRIFSTSNPQDMHESVLHVIAKHPNICKHIHLPVQSGSNRILEDEPFAYPRRIHDIN